MNGFKAFFREKGLYLTCLALVFAAAITGIWAVRSVVRNVQDLTQTQKDAAQKTVEEEQTWDLPDTQANAPVTDVPRATSAPSAASSALGSSSGASQPASAAPDASGSSAASSTRSAASRSAPVAGEVSVPYSGDELVYNATLGDWRTHNGVDYACDAGAQVCACTAGEVTAAYTDALWGGVVELTDAQGLVWRYCGLAAPAVAMGETIAAGGAVGVVAELPSEAADGAHLHLECLQDGNWVDPAEKAG